MNDASSMMLIQRTIARAERGLMGRRGQKIESQAYARLLRQPEVSSIEEKNW
jgi:hypothetical protein